LVLPSYDGQSARIVGGREFVILRNEIRRQTPKSDFRYLRKAFVTFGGSARRDLFDQLIPLLTGHDMEIKVVVGNDATRDQLARDHSDPSITWIGEVSAEDMASLMAGADLAISAGGQTLHELAFLGVPTIGIGIGSRDHQWNLGRYVEAGFLLQRLDAGAADWRAHFSRLLGSYQDSALRREMGSAGRRVTDGQGAIRVAHLLA
jgi:UDP-2,4-diacetamido-2,4,6-trideoxy-beta-L-altropyranose hydrolase